MYNPIRMNVLHGGQYLLHDLCGIGLGVVDAGDEAAGGSVFHQQEDVVFVLEVAVEFYYVGMVEFVLDF